MRGGTPHVWTGCVHVKENLGTVHDVDHAYEAGVIPVEMRFSLS